MSVFAFRSWAGTHPGARRAHNEDSYVDRPDLGLWAVADGAGGREAGEVAAWMIADMLGSIPMSLSAAALHDEVRSRIGQAHQKLRAEAARRGESAVIAAALVVMLARDDRFTCLWAGDARAYLLRNGMLSQLSHDHSLAQALADAGAISAAEMAAHPRADILTRAVGGDLENFALDEREGMLTGGDRFLLCSDGVSKSLTPAELTVLLGAPEGVAPSELLLAAALGREAADNITAVAIEARAPK
ncbi:MAG TPA: PP2C family serine/threonine-protein phosphatase [Acetobacteraceae bacterium]|nr:PP2C family serine/threonine-protein phosphatase [Acetobacteraceae bacterium]